jgi:nicotinamide-nucleotide amidase
MAIGALSQSAAQVAVAVTGVAGPDGGTADKPVGTVCFAWAVRRDATSAPWVKTETRRFDGDRAAVRTATIVAALQTLVGLMKQRQDIQAGTTG